MFFDIDHLFIDYPLFPSFFIVPHKLPLIDCSSSMLSKSALKLPAPNPKWFLL